MGKIKTHESLFYNQSLIMSTNKSYRSALIFLTTLFFLWGFITVLVDSLSAKVKRCF